MLRYEFNFKPEYFMAELEKFIAAKLEEIQAGQGDLPRNIDISLNVPTFLKNGDESSRLWVIAYEEATVPGVKKSYCSRPLLSLYTKLFC